MENRRQSPPARQVKGVDLDHLYRIFGEDTVFLPIPKGTKAPRFKGWQNVTLEKSRSAAYQKRLTAEGNIGVLVGKPSSGLCSIDFDDERYFLDFLKLNPGLKKSTTTKGQRGCNLWVRITGDYPALAKITTAAKEAVGEWRADGGQTVVHGIHPEGNSYTISGAHPVEIPFSDIKWPKGWVLPWENAEPPETPLDLPPAKVSEPPANPHPPNTSYTSTPLHPTPLHNRVRYVKGVIEADSRFRCDHAGLVELYGRFVEPVFQAFPHSRNGFIQGAVPFLYEVVGPSVVVPLVMYFYDTNCRIFDDPREQHEQEAISMLKKVETEFEERHLSEEERGVYELLDDRHKTGFRIMRGLPQ